MVEPVTAPPQTAQVPELLLPNEVQRAVLVMYRSFGLGVWGCLLRAMGMPLEKIALEANSGRVSAQGSQLAQAVKQVYARGWADPFLCITRRSLTAWFLQYGMMGLTFQVLDLGISKALGVNPQAMGQQIFREPPPSTDTGVAVAALTVAKGIAAPLLAGGVESFVANKAECERHLGPAQLKRLVASQPNMSRLAFTAGPAFLPNMLRNFIMAEISFVATPSLFQNFSQDSKSPNSLFWFGLGMNVFIGNSVAIMMQSLWGRSLDALNGRYMLNPNNATLRVGYRDLIRSSLAKEGPKAFFSPGKWFARVLMNAPAQGTIPWFNNVVLPVGEPRVLAFATSVYSSMRKP